MASQLAAGSGVLLPTRSPVLKNQQPRAIRPALGNSLFGSSYSSVGTAFGMPSVSSSSRTANRRVVTMAAKGERFAALLAASAGPPVLAARCEHDPAGRRAQRGACAAAVWRLAAAPNSRKMADVVCTCSCAVCIRSHRQN